MKKQWFSYIVKGASYPEEEEVLVHLDRLSDGGVPDESIKITFDADNEDVVILYRHTHQLH
jgi:hypothetical protein